MKLGDAIAKVTEATGLDKLAEEAAQAQGRSGCGCNKGREAFNNGQYVEGAKTLASNAAAIVKHLFHPPSHTARVGQPYSLYIGEVIDGSIPGMVIENGTIQGIGAEPGEYIITFKRGRFEQKTSIVVIP